MALDKSGYHFFAMLARMKYISRWGLMRSIKSESLSEHTVDTAFIAHALAVIDKRRFGSAVDPEKVVAYALYHDAAEILTGDLPTPVKYYNDDIKRSYKQIEHTARQKLLNMLPDDLRPDFSEYMSEPEGEIAAIVKAADKLSALIKCNEEEQMGNHEFSSAKKTIMKALDKMELPALRIFMSDFLPSYGLTLDEQG